MLETLLNIDDATKKRIINYINGFILPIKCYAILIIILLIFLNYNILKLDLKGY